MKKYVTPIAKKVEFSYQDHVLATGSFPLSTYADPWDVDTCTRKTNECSLVYYTKAKGVDDCYFPPET